MKYKCPNCGAPVTGNKCEYCGTSFEDDDEKIILWADNVPYYVCSKDGKLKESERD